MKDSRSFSFPPAQTLRAEAESSLAKTRRELLAEWSPERLLHELQVHEIELEMQNESMRLAQEAQQESLDRYVALYDFAPIGYLTLTDSGLIIEANLTVASMLGVERHQLLRRRFDEFVSAGDREGWQMHRYIAMGKDEKESLDLSVRCGDKTTFVGHLECRRITGAEGALTLFVSIADITERKQAEIQLQLNENRLRLAKEAAHLGVFDHGIADGTHEWDARARELWGFDSTEEMTFEKFMAGVHPDDRAATQAAVDRALDPNGVGEYVAEYRVINRQDGIVRHIAANGRVSFVDGRPVRFTGTIKDISEQKQLELAAGEQRSEMALLVNQQVAAHTAAAIAHELNQPLVAISAYSEAALRMLSENTLNTERLNRALNGAVEQAQRAGRTLHELLEFLHRGETESEPVDLNGAVLDGLALAAESGYADFRQIVELEPDLRPVLANRLQLQKVLVILFQNSVDAMRSAGVAEGAITITVRTMAGGSMAHVTVQDTGPGLESETAHRIFEPFFTTKQGGIGLGLAISRALIEAHGGQLWAEVDRSPGATFHFTLPFAP